MKAQREQLEEMPMMYRADQIEDRMKMMQAKIEARAEDRQQQQMAKMDRDRLGIDIRRQRETSVPIPQLEAPLLPIQNQTDAYRFQSHLASAMPAAAPNVQQPAQQPSSPVNTAEYEFDLVETFFN